MSLDTTLVSHSLTQSFIPPPNDCSPSQSKDLQLASSNGQYYFTVRGVPRECAEDIQAFCDENDLEIRHLILFLRQLVTNSTHYNRAYLSIALHDLLKAQDPALEQRMKAWKTRSRRELVMGLGWVDVWVENPNDGDGHDAHSAQGQSTD